MRSLSVDRLSAADHHPAMITNLCITRRRKKLPFRGPRIDACDRPLAHIDPAEPRRLDGVFYCPVSRRNPIRRWTHERPSKPIARPLAAAGHAGADRAQSIDFLRRRPAGFRVLTGEDARYYEALVDGADGAILLSAHIETDIFASVRTLLTEGDRDAARARWDSISDLTELLFAEPGSAPAKYWLWRTGLIDSVEVRPPIVEVSAPLAARLDAEIDRRLPVIAGSGRVAR